MRFELVPFSLGKYLTRWTVRPPRFGIYCLRSNMTSLKVKRTQKDASVNYIYDLNDWLINIYSEL